MKLNFISKYFPPEKYLKPLHLGISFSEKNIKAVFFDKTKNNYKNNYHIKSIIVPLEKNAISSGKIVDIDEVVKKLSEVRKNFDFPFVFFAVPDELTFVFSVSVPIIASKDITENIAFTMEENVPLALSDVVFDFTPVSIFRKNSELFASVVVVAAVKNEVEKFIYALKQSGFEPIGCAHESQAIANALVASNFSGAVSIVHARENRVGIYLIKNNLVYFSTLRSISGQDYEKQFLDEYQKFLEYCVKYDTSSQEQVKTILVCGEFSYAKKIAESILNLPNQSKEVKLSNVWTNVSEIDRHLPDLPYEESINFAGPVGAVLADIN